MRYHVLATDYDGTLARHGVVAPETLDSLERLRDSGRRLMLVTGREMEDLRKVCNRLDLFDAVVAENGALLYRPSTREEKPLGVSPPPEFVKELRRRGVKPLSEGKVIVATWTPHEKIVLETIRDMGLELHIIFNKGAVMVLPTGVNKAIGLKRMLKRMGLSRHNAVGVGDAENDHAFMEMCECAVAVGNALPVVKARADWVTGASHGAGVAELIDRLLEEDLVGVESRLVRHHVVIGRDEDGHSTSVSPYSKGILLIGASGSGKTSLASGVLERLDEAGYQFCLFDPEGDYETLEGAVVLGDTHQPPAPDEVLSVLARPGESVVVNLVGLALRERPAYFHRLLPELLSLRARTGRPHWLAMDEAHHLLPMESPLTPSLPARWPHGVMFITVHPERVHPRTLAWTDTVAVVGTDPAAFLESYSKQAGLELPAGIPTRLDLGEALVWKRAESPHPVRVRYVVAAGERKRHIRKYAEGELGTDKSFYFRGPKGILNLRAQNLMVFLQMAEGVDDGTWFFHLHKHHYSQWVRRDIKDADLADGLESVERNKDLDARESRARIRAEIESRYTAPA